MKTKGFHTNSSHIRLCRKVNREVLIHIFNKIFLSKFLHYRNAFFKLFYERLAAALDKGFYNIQMKV